MEFKSVDKMDRLIIQREKEGAKLNYTISQMSNENRIKIDSKDFDMLKEFFAKNCFGEKIPMIFKKALIEVKMENQFLRIFVEFKEDDQFVFLDIFYNWNLVMKMVVKNKFLKYVNGKPLITAAVTMHLNNGTFNSSEVINELAIVSTDTFFYAFLFLEANFEDKTLYKEDTVQMLSEEDNSSDVVWTKSSNNKKYTPAKRKNVYVPKKRRKYNISNVTGKQLDNVKNTIERKYHLSEWPVRGYTYKRKNGTEVTVPPRVSKRRKPNEGEVKTGNNYIIKNE